MAYSFVRTASRVAAAIIVCPAIRIALGLVSGIFLYIDGSIMAEKLTALGYAVILQGVVCVLVAIASIFVKTRGGNCRLAQLSF